MSIAYFQLRVSCKDITNLLKLSPQNNSRGKNKEHSQKLGQFDRVAFKQSGETLFDEIFEFGRGLKDSFIYANTLKNGSAEQKAQMQTLEDRFGQNPEKHNLVWDLSKDVAEGLFKAWVKCLVLPEILRAICWIF